MAPTTCADARHLTRLRYDVVDDIVRTAAANAAGNKVELEHVSGLPGDTVIRAGRIAADADCADQLMIFVVECQSASEHVHTTDLSADHGIVVLSVVGGISAISDRNVDRVAFLKPEQGSAGLNGAIEIGGGQCQTRQAEFVGRVRFLCRNHAASRPLVTTTIPRKRNSADFTVAVYNRSPHFQ